MITKIIHSTFVPPASCRRKRSEKTVIRSQNQMIQAKNTAIVQSTEKTMGSSRESSFRQLLPPHTAGEV